MKTKKEPQEQKALVAILRAAGYWTVAPNNGAALGGKVGSSRFARWNHLHAMGATPGVPDLLVMGRGERVWIEMKRDVRHRPHEGHCPCLSPEQIEWAEFLAEAGENHIVAHGCADALKQLGVVP